MAKKAKEAEVVTPAVEAEVAAPQTSVEPVSLTVVDLQLIAQIVDLASKRGAFHAAEFEQVGAVYTKLANFLKHVASVQEKEKAAAEADTAEAQ